MSFFQNTNKPVGLGGKLMVKGMNGGSHAKLAQWGLSHLEIPRDANILDAGCGGGANVKRLLEKITDGHVTGLDYSEISVAESKKVNRKSIADGLCDIVCADVRNLPFADETFDIVTAFETIYFLPDTEKTFEGILKVLKPGGVFFICNESDGHDKEAVKFSKIIDGMKLYDKAQLVNLLEKSGFKNIEPDESGIWLCVKAEKPL